VREERLPFAVHASGWLRSETRQKERVCGGRGRIFFLQLYRRGINRLTAYWYPYESVKIMAENRAAVSDFGQ